MPFEHSVCFIKSHQAATTWKIIFELFYSVFLLVYELWAVKQFIIVH